MRFWTLGGFFSSVKGHVVKWWQLVIMPVLRINNNDRTQLTQQPLNQSEQLMDSSESAVQQVSPAIQESTQKKVQPKKTEQVQKNKGAEVTDAKVSEQSMVQSGDMSTEDPMRVLRRINEEKEERRRKEIENAKQKASEEARIAAIMNANKVDVNAFIEAGKAAKEEIAAKKAEEQRVEDMRRAQEIMDRLNREAAEDEAKKRAEIDAAKQEAKKHFG